MDKRNSQKQNIVIAIIHIIIILVSYSLLVHGQVALPKIDDTTNIWFISGILLVVLGKYLTEPFFTSPTDTLTNSISLFLALLSITNKESFIGYKFLKCYSIGLFALSILHIWLKDKNEKFKNASYYLLKKIGNAQFVFSIMYFLATFSYFYDNTPMMIGSFIIWIFTVPIEIFKCLIDFFNRIFKIAYIENSKRIGIAEKNIEEIIYIVSIDKNNENRIMLSRENLFIVKTDANTFNAAIEIRRTNQIDTTSIYLCLLEDEFKFTRKDVEEKLGILGDNDAIGSVYVSRESLISSVELDKSTIYSKKNNYVGFILPESNINLIKIIIINKKENRIQQGSIIAVDVRNRNVLYQIIDGVTKADTDSGKSSSGYICALARKIGIYDYSTNKVEASNWMPNTYDPVYYNQTHGSKFSEASKGSIGRLPNTDMQIRIEDINSLVTHNTAVLGILGIGKSCLTFELVKQIVANDIKVICLDITDQYGSDKGLTSYLKEELINNCPKDLIGKINGMADNKGSYSNPNGWGNVSQFKKEITELINSFADDRKKKVLIINPETFDVKRAGSKFNIEYNIDVSLVEKVQIISEVILEKCMQMGQINKGRCCVVYEEAHALVPESNSVVLKEDSNHSNGTARVILQGRKYGLGCIIVTQRTANVTKSILNQCNTIFAMRVFDDTGKSFLENYIGSDYSNVLPTLEERHAIAIGKGLGLKQPIIIQLNDADDVKLK